MNKKICILSMQRVLNYGSLLQAYSLKKMIESLGYKVNFIDISSNPEENEYMKSHIAFDEGIFNKKSNFIYRLLKQDYNPFYIFPKIYKKRQMVKKQIEFTENTLMLKSEDNQKRYDTCVIGSDEVFNCMQNTEWGFTSQLFGNVPQANHVITYAASCGFTLYNDVPNEIKSIIGKNISNFSAMSVRDKNTYEFVNHFFYGDIQMHLDPVVLGNFDDEMLCCQQCIKKLPKKYCVIYAYNGRISDKDEIKNILHLCKKYNMKPVSIGGKQQWVHTHMDLSPFEVLVAFKNAEFVYTDTFHGTIFSAKYSQHFAIKIRKSNANKLNDLVEKLDLNQHKIEDNSKLEDIYKIKHNKEGLDNIVYNERIRTMNYLEANL